METSLHRQLKEHYAGADGEIEVRHGRYRIDVVRDERLIEIQHGGLAAIRDKVRALVDEHDVLVVKPIVFRKQIIRRKRKGGKIVSSRLSPKRGRLLDLFHDLIHFTRAFPHPRLSVEAPLVEIEEDRHPGHGRRRRWRRKDFEVSDQRLVSIVDVCRFSTPEELMDLLPVKLPASFDTGDLASLLGEPRWIAQRITYCLRNAGAIEQVAKRGNAWVYERTSGAGRQVA